MRASKATYSPSRRIVVAAVALLLGISTVAILLPHIAGAAWPFSRAGASEEGVFVHDPAMRVLIAANGPGSDSPDQEIYTVDGSVLVPAAGPDGGSNQETGESRRVEGSIQRYTVKDGDTVSGIAARFGVSANTLLWANDISNPALVRPGTELIILPVSGIRHVVVSGDTLASIAKRYGADEADTAAFNGIPASSSLRVGEEVIVPGGELSRPTKKAETQRAAGRLDATKAQSSSAASSGMFTSPVPGAVLTQAIHGWNGVDLGAPNGTPVYAAAAGTVIVSKVGGYNGGYGNYIVIDHGQGVQTLYSHLATDLVVVGQEVSRGERIGTVGMTGAATGFHLHFEVRGTRNPFAGCSVMSRCSI